MNFSITRQIWLACLLLPAFFLTSCTEEAVPLTDETTPSEIVLQTTIVPSLNTDVEVLDGMPVFRNMEDFHATLFALLELPATERNAWEESIGFRSLGNLYDRIVLAEWNNKTVGHSELYRQALRSGRIVERTYGDRQIPFYEINLFNPVYAPVINEDGLVMIGDDVYRFTADALLIWEQAGATVNGQSTPTRIIELAKSSLSFRSTSEWFDNCNSDGPKGSLLMEGVFLSEFPDENEPGIILIKHYINTVVQVRDPETGEMKIDPGAVVSIEGDSEIELTLTNGIIMDTKRPEVIHHFRTEGGNAVFMPIPNGLYEAPSRYTFTQPAQLLSADWTAVAETSQREVLTCRIGM